MITHIGPESGGESQGILRVDITLPISPDELVSLHDWFRDRGWSIEQDQIDDWFDNLSFTCPKCNRIGNVDDGIDPNRPRCPDPRCAGIPRINPYEVNT